MKDLLYLIGPYRANTIVGVLQNILIASEAAKALWRKGFHVICPHMNSALILDGVVDDETILAAYRDIMLRCDGIAVMPGWRASKGSVEEMREAFGARMPSMPVRWLSEGNRIIAEGWDGVKLPPA